MVLYIHRGRQWSSLGQWITQKTLRSRPPAKLDALLRTCTFRKGRKCTLYKVSPFWLTDKEIQNFNADSLECLTTRWISEGISEEIFFFFSVGHGKTAPFHPAFKLPCHRCQTVELGTMWCRVGPTIYSTISFRLRTKCIWGGIALNITSPLKKGKKKKKWTRSSFLSHDVAESRKVKIDLNPFTPIQFIWDQTRT